MSGLCPPGTVKVHSQLFSRRLSPRVLWLDAFPTTVVIKSPDVSNVDSVDKCIEFLTEAHESRSK
jgi:hypothetical protein